MDIGRDPKTGGRKQKKQGGLQTKKEAEAAAAILKNEINQGFYVEESDVTFEAFAIEWLSYMKKLVS